MNSKQTSKSVASLASATLTNANSSAIAKTLAASALAQSRSKKQTGPEMEAVASAVIRSTKYNDETKKLAASLVSQSVKDR